MRGDTREEVLCRRDNNESVVAQRIPVRGLFAPVRSISVIECMQFVNQDFNPTINTRRCAVFKTRPEEQTRANFVGQPLRLDECKDKLKSIAMGRSKTTRIRLHIGIHLPYDRDTFSILLSTWNSAWS
jgi:hypothetical protein